MKVTPNQTDQLWNLEHPTIPPRSHLFHLEPIGIGTPYVESLTSYIARLAAAHSVPTGTLVAREIIREIAEQEGIKSSNRSTIGKIYGQQYIKSLNGTQLAAKQIVTALSQLTLRDNLEFLTLLPWAQVFPVRELLKPHFAWCPQCYQECLGDGKIIYSPLLWSLQVVTICPYHYQPLHSICPHCHQQFVPLWQTTRQGYCLKCNGWLGDHHSSFEKPIQELTNSLEWELEIAKTLGELLEKAIQFPAPPTRDTIKKAISAYANQYTQGNVSAFGRAVGIPRHLILHWHLGTSIPIVSQLLSICHALSISLVDFLQVEVSQSSRTLDNLPILFSLPPQAKRKSSVAHGISISSRHDLEVTHRAMEQALSEEPPPTLTQLAYRLGYKSYAPLVNLSKSLATAIKTRAADYAVKKRQQKIRELLQGILISHQDPPLSLTEVARVHHIGLATLYRYGSDICQSIVERYKDYRLLRRQEIIQQGCSEVRQLAPLLYDMGINPTLKNIRHFMAKPSALWKKEVVEALWEVRCSLEKP